MLYENENVFDGVTGKPTLESLEAKEEQVVAQVAQNAEYLESLSLHPGWKLIRHDMELAIEKGREMLMTSRTLDHTREWQEFVKARQSLLRWIDAMILEGKTLAEENSQARR